MLPIIKFYKFTLSFSAILVLASIASLIIFGLNPGIDFRGGSLIELKFQSPIDAIKLAADMDAAGFSGTVVQPTGGNHVLIKTRPLTSNDERTSLYDTIKKGYGEFDELRFDSIGPVIGKELTRKAFWQVGLVIVGILLYIAYAFRSIGSGRGSRRVSSWRLSWAAIIALAHDLLITMGVFAILGKYLHVEVDALFITALLTILGFSVHDTIVVFDRIREHVKREQGLEFDEIVNISINETLARSLNTSATVLFVLLALALFGGASIFYFILALLVGITFGTYSSIFVASFLLLVWNKRTG